MTPELEAAYADLAAVARDIRLDEAIEYEGRIDACIYCSVDTLHALRAALKRVDKAERGTT